MALHDFEPHFPNRPPTWLEVVLTVSVILTLLPNLVTAISSPPTVVVGFVLTTAALVTEGVEDWLHRIGMDGRVLLIMAVFLVVPLIDELAPAVSVLLNDAATGLLVATVLYFAVFVARERAVSGWTATQESAE
ncbi:MAG: hypothetical protein J07HN4v3_02608 [Halonotius sp. J07HN4]|nr:MAG: hypothetical protein J07HN4v3_02608 [Halonotius sp. J07HN4]